MTSEFLNQKLAFVFYRVSGGDEYLSLMYLQDKARRLATAFGHAPGSVAAIRTVQAYTDFWHKALVQLDRDQDDRVDCGEWVEGYLALGGDESKYMEAVEPAVQSLVNAADVDGDGELDEAEFSLMHSITYEGIDPAEVHEIFTRMDTNHNGRVGTAEVARALYEYLTSDDPAVPGTWFFGNPDKYGR